MISFGIKGHEPYAASDLEMVGDRVLIERCERSKITKAGIHLPDCYDEKLYYGRVCALGRGRELKEGKFVPFTVKIDDYVIFDPAYKGFVKIGDKEFIHVREEFIYAIIKNFEGN